MLYFQNPDKLCGIIGYCLKKGMFGRGGPEGVNYAEMLNLNIGSKKDFRCIYVICPWFARGTAAKYDSIRSCSQK